MSLEAEGEMKRLRASDPGALKGDFCNLISFVPARSKDGSEERSQTALRSPATATSTLSGTDIRKFYEKVTTTNETRKRNTPRNSSSSKTPQKKRKVSELLVQSEITVDHRKKMEFLRNVEQGEVERVREALLRGMPVDARDQYGWTALMCASCAGHLPVVRLLLEAGADVGLCDNRGRTAARLAGKRGHQSIVKVLTGAESSSSSEDEDISPRDENSGNEPAENETHSTGPEDKKTEVKSVYCEDCKETVTGDTASHFTSILHLLNRKGVAKGPDYFLHTTNKGYQLMVKHGWDEEKGLGSEGQGRKFPVKTVLKRDRKGIGCEQKEKPKVTHFSKRDVSAVESVYAKSSTRKMNVRTLSKRAQRAKERRDKAWEIELRRYMNTD